MGLISYRLQQKIRSIKMIEYPRYKKVLFCTDFSKNADCAFDDAVGLAKRDDAVLYILHVVQEIYPMDFATHWQWDNFNREQEEARKDLERKYIDQYLNKIKDKSKVKIVTKFGRADHEILEFARGEGIDIITMGSHGKTGIENAFFGRVAEHIVRYSPIRVLVVPCKGKSCCA
jgi:nucleotide-binding universal stress UspA family protein